MSIICLNISNNIISISNNNYIINDVSSNSPYGLSINDGSYSQSYELLNIPNNKPLRFFINKNDIADISNIIEVSYNEAYGPIKIYVSKGNDISFDNGDYFRFYDECFNLININNHTINNSSLTDSNDNFYFMTDVSYQFIATTDFSSASPFCISQNEIVNSLYQLTNIDSSFILNIPSSLQKYDNTFFYTDLCNVNILGELKIAVKDGFTYYNNNIKFNIKQDFSNNGDKLSLVSIDQDVSNINFFEYNNICNYILDGTNIISNELSNRNEECLNLISKVNYNNNENYYEFNLNNHFINNENNISNLNYNLYNGVYYIIDICINYPIRVNNDSSNILIIDDSYNNLYEHSYKIGDYYYGSIKLKVNYNDENNIDTKLILDISNNSNTIKFGYTEKCSNPNNINIVQNRSKFNLINQYNNEFNNDFYINSDNHYILNIYDNFIEPSNNIGLIAKDYYNHDLTSLVINNAPSDLSNLLSITNNYDISNFLITYNLTTYDEQTYELYRYVKINYGPFIEISGLSNNYYLDNNNFNNIINIFTNDVSPFDLNNIIVYLKNKNNNEKIYLKFDLKFLSTNRYNTNATYNNNIQYYNNVNISDICYNKNVKFPNNSSAINYYLSRNLIHFNYQTNNSNILKITGSNNNNENPIVLQNVSGSSITFDNSNSKILNDKYILSFFNEPRFFESPGQILPDSNSYIDESNNYFNQNFITFYSYSLNQNVNDVSFVVTNIEENIYYDNSINLYGLIEFIQTDKTYNKLNTKLYLNEEKFIISFNYLNQDLSNHNITLSGEFIEIKFFSNSFIDISYIGNYEFKIFPLGLSENDNFLNYVKDDISFLNYIQDISKNYKINIIDNINPTIKFANSNRTSDFSYIIDIPRILNFDLIPILNNFNSNSLLYLSESSYNEFIFQNRENSNKPIIIFNDNSIYNIDLSYSIINLDNIITPVNNNILNISDQSDDASAIIQYYGFDLCGNKSNNISLTLKFKDIPELTLSGEIVIELEIGNSYIEKGINIDNSFNDLNNLILNNNNFIDFSINDLSDINNKFNINFNASDLCLNKVGLYDISYILTDKVGKNETYLKRFIHVKDTINPYIIFPDLSLINYDFSNINNVVSTLNSLNNNKFLYSFDTSRNNIIDFSLSLFSSIEDLSSIIYKYDLSDNYFKYNNSIDTSIILEILDTNNQDISYIDFKNSSLQDISSFLFNNNYTNIYGKFIILTQSSDLCYNLNYYKPELSFNYVITDICNNSFNFTRKVNLINYEIPDISFINNSSIINELSNNNIIKYNNNNIDFSYQIHNYKKNPIKFINEISNILFSFDIYDSFLIQHNINLNENIVITISYDSYDSSDFSRIKLSDLSNLYDNCLNNTINYYNDLSNIIKQFSIIDNCFSLIYEFSNNQYKSKTQKRNVNIINTINSEISLNLIYPENDINTINISFGDIDFLINKYFILTHPRITNEDVSFELSYNANPNDFNLISKKFDASALIYQYNPTYSIKSYNFQFYNTITNYSGLDSSNLDVSINVIIQPPYLINNSSLNTITHLAGQYINDLSFIENVAFFSNFDEFYYNNNNNISYSETNFTLSFEKLNANNDFNQNNPLCNLSGDAIYKIIYNVSDNNNISISFDRLLIIQDKDPPLINLNNQENINIENFLQTLNFEIAGFNVEDNLSYLKNIDICINLYIDNSFLRVIDICNINLLPNNINTYSQNNTYILTFNDISDVTNNFLDIKLETIYNVTDIKNNNSNALNILNLNFSELIKLNIFILYNNNSYELNKDFTLSTQNSSKWFLKYENNSRKITYDASTTPIDFSFSIESSNNNINNVLNLDSNKFIIPNSEDIIYTNIGNNYIYFQLFYIPDINDNLDPIIKTKLIELNIVDKTAPKLSFTKNNIFENVNIIELPLISLDTKTKIENNINFLFNNEINYNYFIYNVDNSLIYNIPSININDIVNGVISLNNNISDITLNYNNIYDISISYSNNNINNSSNILTESGNIIQYYNLTEKTEYITEENISEQISRTIQIKRFEPFINIFYNNDYKKTYLKQYSLYKDLGAEGFDYYDGSYNEVKTIQTINENNLGVQNIVYEIKNTNNDIKQNIREVHVVDICCIFFNQENYYDISNIANIFDQNIRYGIYGTLENILNYNFFIDPSSNYYIAIKCYKNDILIDNSNSIYINYNELINNTIYNNIDDCSYVNGNIIINVKNNFDRASLFWIHTTNNIIDNSGVFSDLFLYNESCNYYIINSNLIDISKNNFTELSIDVSGRNINDKALYFTICGDTFEPTKRKILHLSYGIYGFKQNIFNNFYNKIKFSYLPDGWHFNIADNSNSDISNIYDDFLLYNNYNNVADISFNDKNDPSYKIYEYTNNLYSNSLAGVNINTKNSYTFLEINSNTPSPLYYYNDNFPKMGGIIYVKNNINFYKNTISLNGNILSKNNGNVFNNVKFNNINNFNEISNNLLFLSCRFNLNNGEKNLNKDFIALTQQNITHNIIVNKDNSKIIFKKYHNTININNIDLSQNYINNNYVIKKDNSYNYLFDNSSNFIEKYKGNYLLLYKFNIDISVNLIETNTINQRFELDTLDFFFNNNELNNYVNFFNKNNLINNIYNINNNNNNIYFIKDNFKFKIDEISYTNQVNLINGNIPYLFFDNNELLNSNRLIFEPIFDNLFTFNFLIYLDYNTINLDNKYKNYLVNNIFNKNIFSNYEINNDFLFFDELIISIFSDISGSKITTTDLSQSIVFSENTIFIKEKLLDSNNNLNTITQNGLNSENLIILSGIDNNNNIFCGLTQQNFTHNIYTTNDNRIFFNKYNYDINNYQVNDSNLSLEKTLLDSSNNNKYFLELSSNDVYNCFIDICENITHPNNLSKKNRLMQSNDITLNNSFNTHITYNIYDEIENTNNYLNKFDIRSLDLYEINKLNDICSNDISYAYANYNNNKNTHSFVIDFIDYLDRNFFDNILIDIPANIINYNNINFVIKDISYSDVTKEFNLYDICANQIILYDKSKISILNKLEATIHITNLKLEYLKKIFEKNKFINNKIFNFLNTSYTFINTLSLKNITTLYDETGFITNTYIILLENKSLNQLYSNVFFNSKQLIQKYNDLVNTFEYFNYYLLPPINNIYNSIINFELVEQLVNDINKINVNIENIYREEEIRSSDDIYSLLQNDISLNKLENYDDLLELTQIYLHYKQYYEIMNYELKLRHDIHFFINPLNESNNYDSSFIEILNIYTINDYYKNLINNMIVFNNMLLNIISLSAIQIQEGADLSSNNYCNTESYYINTSKYDPIDISYLKILTQDISTNFNIILASADFYYEFKDKESIFNNINYVLNGSKIFINAFKSTNILFKLDLFYNSYLFQNIYLDTLILDVIKPDLNPPTIIFNNNNISINQSDLKQNNLDNIITRLIQDISYIEIHESSESFEFTDVSYTYSEMNSSIPISISNNLIESNIKIEIDISNIGTNNSNNLEVVYKITDNANNKNIINRNIRFITSINLPQLYYENINNEININSLYEIPVLNVNFDLDNNSIIELAKNNIIIKDSQSEIYYTKEDVIFNQMLSIELTNNILKYTLTSLLFNYIEPSIYYRLLSITTEQDIQEQQEEERERKKEEKCCYPPAFYYPIQHNYKLGQQGSYKMRLAKFIINNHK